MNVLSLYLSIILFSQSQLHHLVVGVRQANIMTNEFRQASVG